MSNYDSQLPVRGISADIQVGIADSADTRINPAKEDGNLASIKTDTDTMAAWDAAGRAKVTIQTDATVDLNKIAGTTTAVNTGNANAGTQRVVLASDQPAVPVTISSGQGDEKLTPGSSTAVAAGASVTHSYTPSATEVLDKVEVAASGQVFVVIAYGTTGSEVIKWRGFTSKSNLMCTFTVPGGIAIASTQTVKVTITNEDKQAFDIFSTIFTNP